MWCLPGMSLAAPSALCGGHVPGPGWGGTLQPRSPRRRPYNNKAVGREILGALGQDPQPLPAVLWATSTACPCPQSWVEGGGQQGRAACAARKVKVCIAMGAGRDAGSRGPHEGQGHAGTGTLRVPLGCRRPQAPRGARAVGTSWAMLTEVPLCRRAQVGAAGAAGPAGPLAPRTELALSPARPGDNGTIQEHKGPHARAPPAPRHGGDAALAKQGRDAHGVP